MFRNRIINGDMRIDQRNNGTLVSNAGSTYILDRWTRSAVNAGVVSVQRVANTAGAYPAYYMRRTVTTADSSVAATDYEWIAGQPIEGLNLTDLEWGTSSAKEVTVSFKVRSSITGTFSVALSAVGASTQFIFSQVTINQANVWEYKTVTFPGNTTIGIKQDNTLASQLYFVGMVGSNYQGTAGAWTSSTHLGASTNTNFMGTVNATFDLSEVQLEAGSVATPFERRPYGTELALCQRYFQYAIDARQNVNAAILASSFTATTAIAIHRFLVSMRAAPTFTSTTASGFATVGNNTATSVSAISLINAGTDYARIDATSTGMLQGGGCFIVANTGTSVPNIALSAEL